MLPQSMGFAGQEQRVGKLKGGGERTFSCCIGSGAAVSCFTLQEWIYIFILIINKISNFNRYMQSVYS